MQNPSLVPPSQQATKVFSSIEGESANAMAEDARPRVLVVEDNRSIHRLIVDSLKREFRTASAFDGVEGLEQACRLRPDLIITDIIMPKLDGERLIAAVRQRNELSSIPILVLTAKESVRERVALLRQGAQDFVPKPFFVEEVLARVRNLVEGKLARDILGAELEQRGTTLVSLANEVQRKQRELRAALEQMEVARDLAERANMMKSNFLRMMSHELRTPVTAMQLHIRLLDNPRDKEPSDRQREALTRLSRSHRRLLQLVDSVLEYARIEDGRFRSDVQSFDLGGVIGDVINEFATQARQKGLELRMQTVAPIPELMSDPRLVRLAIANLVTNALQVTEKGFVQVAAGFAEGVHHVQVQDSGPGLTRTERVEIFEPLKRFDDIRRAPGVGSGLGLAMVKEMVGAMGGEIGVESDPGAGATFTVTFPAMRAT